MTPAAIIRAATDGVSGPVPGRHDHHYTQHRALPYTVMGRLLGLRSKSLVAALVSRLKVQGFSGHGSRPAPGARGPDSLKRIFVQPARRLPLFAVCSVHHLLPEPRPMQLP